MPLPFNLALTCTISGARKNYAKDPPRFWAKWLQKNHNQCFARDLTRRETDVAFSRLAEKLSADEFNRLGGVGDSNRRVWCSFSPELVAATIDMRRDGVKFPFKGYLWPGRHRSWSPGAEPAQCDFRGRGCFQNVIFAFTVVHAFRLLGIGLLCIAKIPLGNCAVF